MKVGEQIWKIRRAILGRIQEEDPEFLSRPFRTTYFEFHLKDGTSLPLPEDSRLDRADFFKSITSFERIELKICVVCGADFFPTAYSSAYILVEGEACPLCLQASLNSGSMILVDGVSHELIETALVDAFSSFPLQTISRGSEDGYQEYFLRSVFESRDAFRTVSDLKAFAAFPRPEFFLELGLSPRLYGLSGELGPASCEALESSDRFRGVCRFLQNNQIVHQHESGITTSDRHYTLFPHLTIGEKRIFIGPTRFERRWAEIVCDNYLLINPKENWVSILRDLSE